MSRVLEIRTYQLKPEMADQFGHLMTERSLPLLRQVGMDVVMARPSLHAKEVYVLMRSYHSIEHRQQSQDAFYNSEAWLTGPRQDILNCIEYYNSVVIEADNDSLQCWWQQGI